MPSRKNHLIIILVVFLFAADRLLKYQAQHSWSAPRLPSHFFGWDPFFNSGVAFSIPLPNWLIILLTMPVLLLITYLIVIRYRTSHHNLLILPSYNLFSLALILAGSLSNLLDRLIYHHTIDYLRLFTGVFNIADFLIIAGFVLYYRNLKIFPSS